MQNHLPIERISDDENGLTIYALYAWKPEGKAIVFIHGYSGDAVQSWSAFEQLLPSSQACKGHDIYFYGYDSRFSDIIAEASGFRDFLAKLLDEPKRYMASLSSLNPGRWDNFTYDHALIVAHSLGAVMARQALLDATRDQRKWPQRCELLLFAPAHKGTKGVDIGIGLADSIPFLKYLTPVLRYTSTAIDDLKEDSPILLQLEQETLNATAAGANPHLKARKVLIAQHEKIVNNLRFANDPAPEKIPGTSHTNICKPNSARLEPLHFLEQCLQ
jgi:pimeloyl-ACP methyl ester carboxylesterase